MIDKNSIESITISSPIKKSEAVIKIKAEAIMLKDGLCYQFSEYTKDKVVHSNISPDDVFDAVLERMQANFKQCNIRADKLCTLLMNKKRQFTLTGVKDNINFSHSVREHNKHKNYIIPEGEYTDWLYKLGLMDKRALCPPTGKRNSDR